MKTIMSVPQKGKIIKNFLGLGRRIRFDPWYHVTNTLFQKRIHEHCLLWLR